MPHGLHDPQSLPTRTNRQNQPEKFGGFTLITASDAGAASNHSIAAMTSEKITK
jgi:hypothetical protein